MNETLQSIVPKVIQKTFLFPEVEEYTFDVVCKSIVYALYKRGWNVPGITIEFYENIEGHYITKKVGHISGNDFHIDFHRSKADANKIGIARPRWQLEVYEDYSGPSLYEYVGNNWDQEKEKFFHGIKVNSKLNGKPRTYLRYTGNRCKHSDLIVHDNDLGREYDLDFGDRLSYSAGEVYNTIAMWLTENVLDIINRYPETGSVDVEPYVLTPFTDEEKSKLKFDSLNILVSGWRTYEKIRDYMNDETSLPIKDRFAFVQARRLLNLGISKGDDINEIAHDGFVWTEPGTINDFNDVNNSLLYKRYEVVGGTFDMITKIHLVTISPKYSNELYVIDASAREEFKDKYFEDNPGLIRMNDETYNEFIRVEARTLTPLLEYDGSFKEPMVLFRRNVELDEVIDVKEIIMENRISKTEVENFLNERKEMKNNK